MEKKNTVCNTNQHWNRFNSWWDSSKAILKCSNTLDKKVFDAGSREYFVEDLESVMTKLSHLQRAHILALYVKYLQPLTNISHFEGKTLKNYVDAICRRLRELEGQQTVLSERYGNWSWACERDSRYEVLRKEMKLKIVTEDRLHRGTKKPTRKADSITIKSFRLLLQRTLEKAEHFHDQGDVYNYVNTMAAAAVFVIMYFCGTRARQEVTDTITKDFTLHHRALIEYKQSCDSKNKELKSDYSFVERESSFIVGETFCSPIYFFLERRPADSIDRFFLYASFSARIGDKILLSKKKPIGINPLGNSMKKHIQQLIEQELVPNGHYTNTSLRKGLMDHLILAGVPSGLADACLGHYAMRAGTAQAGFSACGISNAHPYFALFKLPITRKKIAVILSDPRLKWSDVEDDDSFHNLFKHVCPIRDQLCSTELISNSTIQAVSNAFRTNKAGNTEVQKSTITQPHKKTAAQLYAELFGESDEDDVSDLDISTISPIHPDKKLKLHHSQTMAQHNSTLKYAVQTVQSGAVVNINFITNHYTNK